MLLDYMFTIDNFIKKQLLLFFVRLVIKVLACVIATLLITQVMLKNVEYIRYHAYLIKWVLEYFQSQGIVNDNMFNMYSYCLYQLSLPHSVPRMS